MSANPDYPSSEEYLRRTEELCANPPCDNGVPRCPCCTYPTLSGRGDYQICPLCHWEDDGQDDPFADMIGGPNGDYTLTESRDNFRKYRTMYRPADTRAFEPTRRQEHLVNIVASLFDAWRVESNPATRMLRRGSDEELWQAARDALRRLFFGG